MGALGTAAVLLGLSLALGSLIDRPQSGGTADLTTGRFEWVAGAPLIGPERRPQPSVSVKDPTVVRFGGKWHVYMTIRVPDRPASMEYVGFAEWGQADRAPRGAVTLDTTYHCAPQLLYFRPQRKWYLIYQWTDASEQPAWFGPAFSTLADPGRPETLSKPQRMFPRKPDNVSGWLDFWVVCDDRSAYLFFTSLDGRMWRSQTPLASFPVGWSRPTVALQADIFEASHTYRLKGLGKYLTMVEAQHGGTRYYKAYLADRLDGVWTPLADTWEKPFAGATNVRFAPGVAAWTDAFSHGELLRDGVDETMTVDPAHLRLLFQGCSAEDRAGKSYGQFPWRLGMLDAR